MQHTILGQTANRDKLDKMFARKKFWFGFYRTNAAVIGATFVIWLAVLFFLFLFLAYRPESTVFPGLHIHRQSPEVGQPVVLENQSSLRQFTEYLARTMGLIPAACSVSERSIQIPPAIQSSSIAESDENSASEVQNSDDADSSVVVAPDPSVPPWPLNGMLGANAEQEFRACRWRNEGIGIFGFFSFGVGIVQKVTLFLLILGLVLVYRGSAQIDLDGICFPGRSKSKKWLDDNERDSDMLVHPVFTQPENSGDSFHPLYPTQALSLDGGQESQKSVDDYKAHVYVTRSTMANSQLAQPFDLILNVLDSGVKHRLVGPMTDRLASAMFDFRERVSNRFWFVDYILWFLPTIGFLGTIYGISVSLVRAKGLFDEDNDFSQVIRQVVDGLGVAFDTTSMALACSAVLYLAMRRTEAKIGPLADKAEETLTELLVDRLSDAPAPPPDGLVSHSLGSGDGTLTGASGDDEKPDEAPEPLLEKWRSGQ